MRLFWLNLFVGGEGKQCHILPLLAIDTGPAGTFIVFGWLYFVLALEVNNG